MSTIIHQKMDTGLLAPGKSQTHKWNNAPGSHVYGFSVEPTDWVQGADDIFTPSFPILFEIVKVEYRLVGSGKRKVFVTVRNNTPVGNISGSWSYTIYMSQIWS